MISTHRSTLKEENRNKTGVVPEVTGLMEKRWRECASFTIIQLEEDGDKYKVTCTQENSRYQINPLVHVSQCTCSCGMWKGYGIPCVDAMICF
jgi:SWIM zinc finger